MLKKLKQPIALTFQETRSYRNYVEEVGKNMPQTREKFATQIESSLLADLRMVAKAEGCQIQALVEEAVRTLLEERRQGKARRHVLDAYQKSHARFSSLYEKLAN